ncbi:MAG: fibronectin type III domain-containing protein [Lachnospiraceae bacterium]|nr:fibronectin type III domain-containing protein [Lachnospiraceae bacterium]
MKKRLFSGFLAVVLSLSMLCADISTVYAEENPTADAEEVTSNLEIPEATEETELADATMGGNRDIPSDFDVPVTDKTTTQYALDKAIPSKYHATLAEVQNVLPDTRNQNPYGTCWSFATTVAMESDMISQGLVGTSVDYSELQLIWFCNNSVVDPLGGLEGDDVTFTSSDTILDHGGNASLAMRSLMRWSGATDETNIPYSNATTVSANGLTADKAYENNLVNLVGYQRINIREDREAAKQAIMDHGAITVSYLHSSSFYNSTNNAYYNSDGSTGGGHAVAAVGWDDSFSASNFSTTPEGDGAWLIRNSWTTTSGMNLYSYFWMSYYDKSLRPAAYAAYTVPAGTYDNNYQYDGGLNTGSTPYNKVANIFTAGGIDSTGTEELESVTIGLEYNTNVTYTISVYTNLSDPNNPTSGTLQSSATTTGTTTYAGEHHVQLKNPVKLESGEQFSVVVEVSSATDYYVGVDAEYGMSLEDWLDSAVRADAGQSYYYTNSQWINYQTEGRTLSGMGNFCIKAYTKNVSGADDGTYKIRFNANGGTGSMSDMTSLDPAQSYTLSANTFKRTGYSFAGWNTRANGTGASYANQATVSNLATGGVVLLYAQWKPNTYTIKFNANGGSGTTPADMNCNYGEYYSLPVPSLSMSGADFAGWNTKADGSGTTYSTGSTVSNLSATNGAAITLYAMWKYNFQNVDNVNAFSDPDEETITLRWDYDNIGANPTGCEISLWDGSDWKVLKNVPYSTASYKHTGVSRGIVYKYRLRTYKMISGKKVMGESAYYRTATEFYAVQNLKAAGASTSSIKLTWTDTKNKSVDYYRIYRSTSPNEYGTAVGQVSGSSRSFTDTGLTTGKVYYYNISFYVEMSEYQSCVYTIYDSKVPGMTTLAKTTGMEQTKASTVGPTFQWGKVATATGYQVYRSTSSGGTYSLAGTITSGSTVTFTDKNLTAGKSYYYKVRAFRKSAGITTYGSWSDVLTAVTAPIVPTGLSASTTSNAVTVKWKQVAGASGYRVYYKTSSGAEWTSLAAISGGNTVSYKHTGLSAGRTYYYMVRAYRKGAGCLAYGAGSSTLTTSTRPAQVVGLKQTKASTGSATIQWSKVSGATGYQIYRATSSKGTYSLLNTVTSGSTVSYTNSKLSAGRTYYYKVRALRKVGSTNYMGSFSAVANGATAPSAPTGLSASTTSNAVTVKWKQVAGAGGYRVYYKTSANGAWTSLATVSGGSTVSYKHTGLKSGKTYYYMVRAYRKGTGYTAYGANSATIKAKTR